MHLERHWFLVPEIWNLVLVFFNSSKYGPDPSNSRIHLSQMPVEPVYTLCYCIAKGGFHSSVH